MIGYVNVNFDIQKCIFMIIQPNEYAFKYVKINHLRKIALYSLS